MAGQIFSCAKKIMSFLSLSFRRSGALHIFYYFCKVPFGDLATHIGCNQFTVFTFQRQEC